MKERPAVPSSAPTPSPASTAEFAPLPPAPTRSHRVANAILREVRVGGIRPGQKLPSETRLAAQFGVSRGVVREAVKSLEAMGVVIARQGSGSFVRDDPGPAVARVLALTVSGADSGADELLELRELLEAAAARLAATRRTETQLGELWRRFDTVAAAVESQDPVAIAQAERQFRTAVHQMSGNRYLAAVLAALADLRSGLVPLAEAGSGGADQSVEQDRRLVEWIAVRSPERAAEAAGARLRAFGEAMTGKQRNER